MNHRIRKIAAVLTAALAAATAAHAGVSAAEAAKLKGELTPLGAERAANKEGTIPAWTGGLTTPAAGYKPGSRRPDPFASEIPTLQITAKNMDQYASKLTEGVKALLKKYPDTYRLDVYPTHRTAAAPQWVYDNTFQNATRTNLDTAGEAPVPKGAYGGIPFPTPKDGLEVMFNAQVHWRGESWTSRSTGYQVTTGGKPVLVHRVDIDNLSPYYRKDGSLDKFNGVYWMVRVNTSAPAVRAGEAILGQLHTDESRSSAWVYLTGQRRVRKLPNSCCDTPHPASAGIVGFDEIEVVQGRLDRSNWKLLGKQEIYVPYNSNRLLMAKNDLDVVGPTHVNPEYVRWELHRVWVVESTVKPGQRHSSPRSVYYIDEDSWLPLLGDRWDGNGQLWRTAFGVPVVIPDLPGVVHSGWGSYELLSGTYYVAQLAGGSDVQYEPVSPPFKESHFAPESLAGEGVR